MYVRICICVHIHCTLMLCTPIATTELWVLAELEDSLTPHHLLYVSYLYGDLYCINWFLGVSAL